MRFMETILGVLSLPVTCWNGAKHRKIITVWRWRLSGCNQGGGDPWNHTAEKTMDVQQRVKAEPRDSTSMTSVSESFSDINAIKTSVIWLCYDSGSQEKMRKASPQSRNAQAARVFWSNPDENKGSQLQWSIWVFVQQVLHFFHPNLHVPAGCCCFTTNGKKNTYIIMRSVWPPFAE